MTSDIHALGQPEQQTTTYAYFGDNLVKSVTDTLGRQTTFAYDGLAHTTGVTRLSGTAQAVTASAQYASPFGQLTNVIDPLGHAVSFNYDSHGNPVNTLDALGNESRIGYNPVGQPVSATDPLGHVTQFGYFGGDLSSATDPLGNVSRQFTDQAGRIVTTTDALGQSTRLQYDPANRVTQITDPAGNVSHFAYDPNGNPLSLTDAAGHTTSYTYDSMDRRATRTDALLRGESYHYDLNGNLSTVTDHKGQVTALSYDGLNRVTSVCFNQTVNAGVTSCESTIGYQYDILHNTVTIVDSLSGTITRVYDDLGRLLTETTPQGSVSYAYDAAGRLITRTVAGQPAITYSYDNDNRVTSVARGAQAAQFTYDADSRPVSMTLPCGSGAPSCVVASYSYDLNSRLVGISYVQGQVTLGNLTYSYDALNRRVAVGGSLARTALPPALTSASYDAANQIVNWNGAAVSYDPNGNMLSDGTNSFTWNSRGQLAGIAGPVNASFGYDAFGRRIAKTIGAQNTGFFYNGGSMVQELNGSSVTANIWSGGSAFLQRADASGSTVPLTDALGSVLALADSTGNLVTQYAYDPFGNTIASGAATGNPSQYIGAQNDATGLYFMQARYYSPSLQRFISEDPLEFRGGDVNLHSYSRNAPTNLKDPSGKSPCLVVGLLGTMAYNSYVIYNSLSGRKTEYYSGWSGFGRILAGNAEAFTAGCMVGQFASTMAEELGIGEPPMPKSWPEAEEWLNTKYGGTVQREFELGNGEVRIVDNLTEDLIAQESKFGPQGYSTKIAEQIAKDVDLMNEGTVKGVEWHFFANPATGAGPSGPLLQALYDAGIDVIYHFPMP